MTDETPATEQESSREVTTDDGTATDGGAAADGSVTTDDVEAALRQVRDPEAEVHVIEAGLIENIHVTDGRVTVEADLQDFPPGEAEAVTKTMMRAVNDVPGVERAHVEHVGSVPDTTDRDVGVEAANRVIAVASAKGGVGKTTVATALACGLAADGRDVGLFDADIHGPNVPELLSISGPVHSDEDGNPIPVAVDGTDEDSDADAGSLEAMSVGLLSSSAPLAWRGAMAHDALSELFEETAWDDPDTVVLDLPPGTGDVALTTLQEVQVDGVVFVTTPFHAAVSDTVRSLQLFEENDVPVLGIVSNMGEFVCDECGAAHDLFDGGDPIAALDAPRLADVPFTDDLQSTFRPSAAALPAHARDLATAAAERLDEIWSVEVPDHAVDLRGLSPEERRERVRDSFTSMDPGAEFLVVSDRDPSPVRGYLDELADGNAPVDDAAVKRHNPETWFFRATVAA
ncbi:P-loop NTPase [Halorientalis marina]|uniref:P-loop NTPase n=1 Tax=Halorientalis marina TaxID=2931976 RepID=UPI001FF1E800|nr:P-loop NTPase [Halorientalis marina]